MSKRDTIAVAGIQARMSSSRLPGKSLADLGGKPLIYRVWERARRARRVEDVYVLTSDEPDDDPIAEYCEGAGIPVRRGPLHDVLARFVNLLAETRAPYVVRITGDCPLVSPEYVDLQLDALEAFDGDFAAPPAGSIALPLAGQGAISARAIHAANESDDPADREHVGSFFFGRNRAEFRTVELDIDPVFQREDLRLCVDEPADLEFVRRVWETFVLEYDPGARLSDLIRRIDEDEELRSIHADVEESAANQRARALVRQNPPRIVGRWP